MILLYQKYQSAQTITIIRSCYPCLLFRKCISIFYVLFNVICLAQCILYINSMIVVVVDSNIGVIRVKYLHVVPVWTLSPKHCAPLLCYSSTLKITSIHSALCFMKILLYKKIYLLQTSCLCTAIRVARSYYNARLRVARRRCVLFTYFLKGCSLRKTNFMWIFDINLLLVNVNHPRAIKWTSS